jgi:hypothetical protein
MKRVGPEWGPVLPGRHGQTLGILLVVIVQRNALLGNHESLRRGRHHGLPRELKSHPPGAIIEEESRANADADGAFSQRVFESSVEITQMKPLSDRIFEGESGMVFGEELDGVYQVPRMVIVNARNSDPPPGDRFGTHVQGRSWENRADPDIAAAYAEEFHALTHGIVGPGHFQDDIKSVSVMCQGLQTPDFRLHRRVV